MNPHHKFHFWPVDTSLNLAREDNMYYLQLGNGSLLGALRQMERSGRNYQKFLAQYPAVMCEPLERYYRCRNATGKLNDEMLQDLLFGSTWREANWGAWLAALAPSRKFLEHLERRRPTLPHGTLVIDLAKASCGTDQSVELAEHLSLLTKIREMLAELPAVRLPLRPFPDQEQERQWQLEAEEIKRLYRRGGLEAARAQVSQGINGYYSLSYKEWLASGAPPPPTALKCPEPPKRKPWWRVW